MPPSPPPTRRIASPPGCPIHPRGARWWSAPAKAPPPWRAPSRRIGAATSAGSRASSSRAMATACRRSRIEVVEAAHPTPDAAGQKAAQRLLQAVQGLGADDLVLVLLSGGGSALLAAPMDGITLDEKRAVTKALLACGANIAEINCVRKHLSTIKGGRLALAAAPARVVTLAISDVPGDDFSTIASGPTVPDPTTCADALEIVDRYGIALPARRARRWKAVPRNRPRRRRRFCRCESHIIATAQGFARGGGRTGAPPGADAAGAGRRHRRRGARSGPRAGRHRPLLRRITACPARPCVLLSGGETTVTVKGRGRGGRNARVPARAGADAEWPCTHPCHCRRHRRHRRLRGQCRRAAAAGYAGARRGRRN
jgi:glycerate 2-kinase